MIVTEFLFGWLTKTPMEDTPLDVIVGWVEGLIILGLMIFIGDLIDLIKKHK